MSSPIILGMVNGESATELDYVGILAEHTEHLEIGVNPDGLWEEAMARVRMIGQISEQRNGTASRTYAIPMPEPQNFTPFTFFVTGEPESYHSRITVSATDTDNLSYGTERYGGGIWLT